MVDDRRHRLPVLACFGFCDEKGKKWIKNMNESFAEKMLYRVFYCKNIEHSFADASQHALSHLLLQDFSQKQPNQTCPILCIKVRPSLPDCCGLNFVECVDTVNTVSQTEHCIKGQDVSKNN